MLPVPNTPFYTNPARAALWRELVYLHREFNDHDVFSRIVSDFSLRLDPLLCKLCHAVVENVAEGAGTSLRCVECGWQPVTVEE